MIADRYSDGYRQLADQDPALLDLAAAQLAHESRTLNLVAAASPTLPAVTAAIGLGFGAVTAEGYPGARYHPGATVMDGVERLAKARAADVFGATHANVQPASGSAANLAVLYGVLRPGDRVLSLDLAHGGHLSHVSARASVAKRITAGYYVVGDDGLVCMDRVAELVRQLRPRLVICGGSACPRTLDFAGFRAAADEVDALLMADISHISGLVAAGRHPSPMPHCDLVTTSTYKQLRGPRGGLVLLGTRPRVSASTVDRAVFPGFQGTPDFGAIAGKAVALGYAARPAFGVAMDRVLRFATVFADAVLERGIPVLTGGTDTHMVLIDLRGAPVSGRVVSDELERLGVLVNPNLVPGDPRPARLTSGIRLGTNDLAFRAVDDGEVAVLAGAVADVVAELVAGGPGGPAQGRLAEIVTELASRDYVERQPAPVG